MHLHTATGGAAWRSRCRRLVVDPETEVREGRAPRCNPRALSDVLSRHDKKGCVLGELAPPWLPRLLCPRSAPSPQGRGISCKGLARVPADRIRSFRVTCRRLRATRSAKPSTVIHHVLSTITAAAQLLIAGPAEGATPKRRR